MFFDFFRGGYVDRTRMRLLLGDAGFRQIIQYRLGLHFEFASQLVDANLGLVRHPLKLLVPFALAGCGRIGWCVFVPGFRRRRFE
jgi:hypothetical protein